VFCRTISLEDFFAISSCYHHLVVLPKRSSFWYFSGPALTNSTLNLWSITIASGREIWGMTFFLLLCLNCLRVSQTGPSAPLGATERFSGGHEQRLSLGSFALILHNSSVTMNYVVARVLWRRPRFMKVWEPLV